MMKFEKWFRSDAVSGTNT